MYSQPRTTSTDTTPALRGEVREGIVARQFAEHRARQAMMVEYNATGSTRLACMAYDEELRLYGYEPEDSEEDDR